MADISNVNARGVTSYINIEAITTMRNLLIEVQNFRRTLIEFKREVMKFQKVINQVKTVGKAPSTVSARLAVGKKKPILIGFNIQMYQNDSSGIIFAKIIGGSAVALLTKGAAVAVLLTYAAERIMTMTGMNVNDTLDLASRSQQGYIDIINHLVDAILRKFEELDTILNKKIVNWLMNSHSWNENEAVDLIKHIGKIKDGIVSVIKSVAAFKVAIERGNFVQATLIVLNLGVVIFDIVAKVNDSWKSNVPVIVARL